MPNLDVLPLFLEAQITGLEEDFTRLSTILQSPKVPARISPVLIGRFNRGLGPLKAELERIQKGLQLGDNLKAWEELAKLQQRSQDLMEDVQEFLGGVTIRQTHLDREMAETAQQMVADYANQAGMDWSPVVIIGLGVEAGPAEESVLERNSSDSLIRIPIPHWDIWYLPLLIHDLGYWVAKYGQSSSLDQFVEQVAGQFEQALGPDPTPARAAPWLAEIDQLFSALDYAQDRDEFLNRTQSLRARFLVRQKIHLWRLFADAFATFSIGPAYAYALIFLILNPCEPFVEGEVSQKKGGNQYFPCDARRAAVVLQVLEAMNENTKVDAYSSGLYGADLNILKATWENALDLCGNLAAYQQMKNANQTWISNLIAGLEYEFGFLATRAADTWRQAIEEVVPLLRNGTDQPRTIDPAGVINSAWWCRARFPDRIEGLSRESERLLSGKGTLSGLHANPAAPAQAATSLLTSQLYDLQHELSQFAGLLHREEINQADRDAVAGRFYRLISRQDYNIRKLVRSIRLGNPVPSSLSLAASQARSPENRLLKRELLDFFGGLLVRYEGLDEGFCALADALLGDYSRMTGVNWLSRTIPGRHPLFSQAVDLIHLRFPDWSVWNLPLLAHEFGHVVALAVPGFETLWFGRSEEMLQGHPDAPVWGEQQLKEYLAQRARHVHEFFADAFAVYSQGPAFAVDVLLLNFNPVEAYLPRDNHPSHGERVELILRVLEMANAQEKTSEYDVGPYDSILKRLKDWWTKAVQAAGTVPDAAYSFHKLQAKSLAQNMFHFLEQNYRLGAQYPGKDWTRAEEISLTLLDDKPDLSAESRLSLLNIAWASRLRHPDRAPQIEQIMRNLLFNML